MTAPCKGCPQRQVGCHGKCEKYAEYNAWNEKQRQARYEAWETTQFCRAVRGVIARRGERFGKHERTRK